MHVLVAPDKFRGTLTAAQAAAAIAAGWRRGDGTSTVEAVPVADGGEGTLDVLVESLGGERRTAVVRGPLGEDVEAEFGLVPGGDGGTLGVVELARGSGLALIPPDRRDPLRATTRGTGELLLAARRAGAARLLVCLGGSATNDAGAGLAAALGIRLLDEAGHDLPPGGGALAGLARVDPSGLDPDMRGVPIDVACDVDNPLTGPAGASAVYGPQKGASPEAIAALDRALARFAAVVRRDLQVDVEWLPGAGAAGGAAAGLVAFLGARLRPGAEVVLEALGFGGRLAGADLVVTGEGTFDAQSLHGKAPAAVLRAAATAGIPAVVLCGRAEVGPPGVLVASLTERFGAREAMANAGALLADLAAEVAAGIAVRAAAGGGLPAAVAVAARARGAR